MLLEVFTMDESHENFIKEADLRDWFRKEKWIDVSRPKKKGKGYEPCGRGDTSKGKKPVCTPANKAKNLTEKERKNRIRQKRKKEKEPNPDKKPNVTKYSPGAGGKSNVSKNYSIRVITGSEKPYNKDYSELNEISLEAEKLADNIFRSGLEYTKELGLDIYEKLYEKHFSDFPYEPRNKLKYLHSLVIRGLSERTKDLKELRLLQFVSENNINIFNFSGLLDLVQEYLDDSK